MLLQLAILACVDALRRPRVIIAPAQFGVPKDYDDLSELLRQRGHAVACAPLSRLSWLRIVPSVFTEAFFKGELKPQGTLDFFFEALDAAVADVRSRIMDAATPRGTGRGDPRTRPGGGADENVRS